MSYTCVSLAPPPPSRLRAEPNHVVLGETSACVLHQQQTSHGPFGSYREGSKNQRQIRRKIKAGVKRTKGGGIEWETDGGGENKRRKHQTAAHSARKITAHVEFFFDCWRGGTPEQVCPLPPPPDDWQDVHQASDGLNLGRAVRFPTFPSILEFSRLRLLPVIISSSLLPEQREQRR